MKKTIIIVLISFAIIIAGGAVAYSKGLFGGGTSSATKGGSTNSIVAIVNGIKLTAAELEKTEAQIASAQKVDRTTLSADKAKALKQAALDGLIGKTLLDQAVAAANTTPTPEAVQVEMKKIKARFKTEKEFVAALAKQGTTEAALSAQTAKDMAAQKYFSDTFKGKFALPTEAEIKATYDKAIVNVKTPPTLKVAHDQIKQALTLQKQQALLGDLIKQLRSKATVVIK